jgi:hypothetical protein
MKKGGLADSPFFSMPQPAPAEASTPAPTPQVKNQQPESTPMRQRKNKKPEKLSDRRDTMTPHHHDTMLDTTVSRYHDTVIEAVRKAVREYGKEAATHRFTLEEKKAIADIIYTYRQRGVKTSENELARIAINFLVSDYKVNGENSILHKVVKALNT